MKTIEFQDKPSHFPPAQANGAALAIGFAQEPDKLYGGRIALHQVVFAEPYGRPWPANAVAH